MIYYLKCLTIAKFVNIQERCKQNIKNYGSKGFLAYFRAKKKEYIYAQNNH